MKKLHKSLTKRIKIKQAHIDLEKRKCNEVQFLKYGRLVPLEVLDKSETNQVGKELQQKLQALENQSKQTYALWQRKILSTRKALKVETAKNTQLFSKCAILTKENLRLNKELAAIGNVDFIEDSTPNDQKRNKELQDLVSIAKTQASQIDILKAEIHMLQRKGGMLYSVP